MVGNKYNQVNSECKGVMMPTSTCTHGHTPVAQKQPVSGQDMPTEYILLNRVAAGHTLRCKVGAGGSQENP